MGGKTLALQKGACQFHGAKSFSDYGQTGEERRLFFLIIHALQSRQWAESVSPKKLESGAILACLVDTQLLDNIINDLH